MRKRTRIAKAARVRWTTLEAQMRYAGPPVLLFLVLYLAESAVQAQITDRVHAALNAPYPTEVSLMQSRAGEWTYLDVTNQQPLYVSDKDKKDKSVCYDRCNSKWVPLLARADSKPLGEWTLAPRKGGDRQWAYRHRPVYMLIHDSGDLPLGDGKEGHHLLPTLK